MPPLGRFKRNKRSSGKRVFRLFLAGLMGLILAAHGCGQDEKDPFGKARVQIKRLMEARNIASFQVAVAKDGQIVYEEAFGWANVPEKIPATNETMFAVASIEKPFVSTAVMILAERGKIDLHGPVNDYLGGAKLTAFQGSASDATVARLLLHVTGLPYGYYVYGENVPREKRRSNADLLGLAGVLVYPPGTVYEYTNFGYGLIDDIAEHAAGDDLREFIMKEIVAPLGLSHTLYFKTPPPKDKVATQNIPGGTLPLLINEDGYSGMYSTAGDLVRFGMLHLKRHLSGQKRILSDAGIDLLRTCREPGVKITSRTLAWDVQEDYGYQAVMHGGGGPGMHNYLYMIPSEDLVIAYMSNAQYPSSTPVLVELLAAAVPKFSALDRFKGRRWPQWPVLDEKAWRGEWAGKISGPKGTCRVAVVFDAAGSPKMRIEGDGEAGPWLAPNRSVQKNYGRVLYRFDARIPYLIPFAEHDEVIITFLPLGEKLIGSASAAKEKDFGRGENYVLPQYFELTRVKAPDAREP